MAAEIPFPEVLEEAAVVQEKITDINREGLVVGNGDLSGILWQRDGGLCLRVTKNDVWDARVDTSMDPALMTVDIPNQKWSGGTSAPHSYQTPYPQPRCPALIRIGGKRAGNRVVGHSLRWKGQRMVGQGRLRDHGGRRQSERPRPATAIRSERPWKVRSLICHSGFPAVRIPSITSTSTIPRARRSSRADGRIRPSPKTTFRFRSPPTELVGAIELYVQSKNGSRAENRIRQMVLKGAPAPLEIPAGMPEARSGGARSGSPPRGGDCQRNHGPRTRRRQRVSDRDRGGKSRLRKSRRPSFPRRNTARLEVLDGWR